MALPKLRRQHIPQPEEKVIPGAVLPLPFNIIKPPAGCGGVSGKAMDKLTGEISGILGVPLSDSLEDAAIRAHEYAHLAVSRLVPQTDKLQGTVPDNWYQAAMDNVVNSYARTKGVCDVDNLPLPGVTKRAEKDRTVCAGNFLQSISASPKARAKKVLSASDKTMVRHAQKQLVQIGRSIGFYASTASDSTKEEWAGKIKYVIERLSEYFETAEEEKKDDGIPADIPGGLKDALKGAPSDGGALPLDRIDSTKYFKPKPDWMTLNHIPVTLDRSIHRANLVRKPRPSFIGAFKRPMRALIPMFDGRAWEVRPKKDGGTILIDVSGSMQIKQADITKLLKLAPYATILAYCGILDTTGQLFTLAKNGRYASSMPSHGGCNGCDGPALRYAVSLPGPHIWICDGKVTGVGDDGHPALTVECEKIRKQYGVIRVPNLWEFYALVGIKN